MLVLCPILTVSGEFPGNTYLFSYTDRKNINFIHVFYTCRGGGAVLASNSLVKFIVILYM